MNRQRQALYEITTSRSNLLKHKSLNRHASIARSLAVPGFLAGCRDFGAHTAAASVPFIAVLKQDRVDQPNDRPPVREDPDDMRAAADLLQPCVNPGSQEELIEALRS